MPSDAVGYAFAGSVLLALALTWPEERGTALVFGFMASIFITRFILRALDERNKRRGR